MLPTLSPWGTVAYFHINRAYIAKVLCENRARPQLHCNGKCYLAKTLKKQQEKKDKETTERVENTPILQLFSLAPTLFEFAASSYKFKDQSVFFYRTSPYDAELAKQLRPPR